MLERVSWDIFPVVWVFESLDRKLAIFGEGLESRRGIAWVTNATAWAWGIVPECHRSITSSTTKIGQKLTNCVYG